MDLDIRSVCHTSVIIPDNTVSISDVNFIGYRDVTGTVHNGLTETLEYVEVFAIVLLSDGTVADIEIYVVATSEEYMLPSSSRDFSISIRPLFDNGQDISVLTMSHLDFWMTILFIEGMAQMMVVHSLCQEILLQHGIRSQSLSGIPSISMKAVPQPNSWEI